MAGLDLDDDVSVAYYQFCIPGSKSRMHARKPDDIALHNSRGTLQITSCPAAVIAFVSELAAASRYVRTGKSCMH